MAVLVLRSAVACPLVALAKWRDTPEVIGKADFIHGLPRSHPTSPRLRGAGERTYDKGMRSRSSPVIRRTQVDADHAQIVIELIHR